MAVFFLISALPVAPAGLQTGGGQIRPFPGPFDSSVDQDPIIAAHQARALNLARQKSLVSDTNKLLQLARELNTEIAAANAESLTPIQERKLAEIEKLAHNVKDKMSDASVGAPPVPQIMSPYGR